MIEFPEFKGHARRDYWLAVIQEILFAHKFINKYKINGVAQDEVLLKAALGVLRLQAIQDISSAIPVQFKDLLMFNLCDELPGGDLILETFANMSKLRDLDCNNDSTAGSGMYSISAFDKVPSLGSVFGTSSNTSNERRLAVGEICVGEITSLEIAVKESRNNYKKVESAKATVDEVKVEGIESNLAIMKVLFIIHPLNGYCICAFQRIHTLSLLSKQHVLIE